MSPVAFPSMRLTPSTSLTIGSRQLIMSFAAHPSVVCRRNLVATPYFVLPKHGMRKDARNQMRKRVNLALRQNILAPLIVVVVAQISQREPRPFPISHLSLHWVKFRSFRDFTMFAVVLGGREAIIGRQTAMCVPGLAYAVLKTATVGSCPSCLVPTI